MSVGRSRAAAVTLLNGEVLVAGGETGSQPLTITASVELYDPAREAWTPAHSMSVPRADFTATLLSDGRVLAAGGTSGGGCLSSAELYDPRTNTWSAAGNMTSGRCNHTATLLPNGRVLVAGGLAGGQPLADAELYDPPTNSWAQTSPMAKARGRHTATRLSDGRVLVAGGLGVAGPLNTVEVYDPGSGRWGSSFPLPPMVRARYDHTATLLPDGRVLVAGGRNASGLLSGAEVFDPGSGFWAPVQNMATARARHTATLLPNGDVLVAGGESSSSDSSLSGASAELFDPRTNSWSLAGTMAASRQAQVAASLPGGRVLVAGGSNGAAELMSAELYTTPPPTPTVTSTRPPTAVPTQTAPPPPPPPPTPQRTVSGPIFQVQGVRVEPHGTQPDWSLARPPLKRVTAGTRVRLSVYVTFTALAGTELVAVSAQVRRSGHLVYQAGLSEDRSGAGRLWDHWSFTPQKVGRYVFQAKVRVGDRLQEGKASFTVTAGAVTFTFDRLQTMNAKGQPAHSFGRTERVIIQVVLTVRGAAAPVRVTVGQTLEYSAATGWKELGRRVESTFPLGNGTHPYTVSYVPQTPYSLLRMVIDVTIGRKTLRRAVAFQVHG